MDSEYLLESFDSSFCLQSFRLSIRRSTILFMLRREPRSIINYKLIEILNGYGYHIFCQKQM